MPEQIEEIMKKLHIYMANCKESAYGSEDIIVSKKRMLALLDELNHAVYDVCEQYEATKEAKTRALMQAESEAAGIKEDAVHRAEDIYAASLVYTEDVIFSIKKSLNNTIFRVRRDYDALLKSYEEKIAALDANAEELRQSMVNMQEAQTYLRLIEDIEEKKKSDPEARMEARIEEVKSKIVGSAVSYETLPEEGKEDSAPADEAVDIKVHSTPKMAEVSTKSKKKMESFFKKLKIASPVENETIEVKEEAIVKPEDY